MKFGYSTEIDIMVSDHNWQFIGKATESAPPMMVPRGKVTGGSSAINGQVFLRGVPEDYDSWAEMGNSEWGYTDCLPYFRKLETDTDFSDDFHGTDGPIVCHRFKPETWHPAQTAFYQACREAGFPDSPDHNNPDSTGVGPTPFNNPGGVRMSTALGYLDQTRHRLNLTIRANCHVQKILFDGNRAVGALVESGGEIFTVEGSEIILSSGAIGSPHILLLSGVGPAAHLQEFGIPVVADLPGVGQNMRDHPLVWVTWRTKPEIPLDGLAPRMQVTLRYTADGSPLRNDMKMSMQSFATERINRGGDRMEPVGIRLTSGIQLAAGAGELRLQSADPAQQPFLDYRYLGRPLRPGAAAGDRAPLRQAGRELRLQGHHPGTHRADGRRAGERRDSGRIPVPRSHHLAAHFLHRQDGLRRRRYGRGQPVRQGARAGWPARGRRLDNARLHPRQHQRDHDDDRRADCGVHQGWEVGGAIGLSLFHSETAPKSEAAMSLFVISALGFLYHRLLRRRSSPPPSYCRHYLTHQPVKMVD